MLEVRDRNTARTSSHGSTAFREIAFGEIEKVENLKELAGHGKKKGEYSHYGKVEVREGLYDRRFKGVSWSWEEERRR